MIKCIIIEDEEQARAALKKMLKLIDIEVQIVATAGSLIKAKELLEQKNFDLVFLDIRLKDATAFDLLDALEILPKFIVFTTAHSEYAIKAFKVHAIDYLLKPINPQELLVAVENAEKQITNQHQLKKLLSESHTNIGTQKIILKTNREHHVVDIHQIIHLQAKGAYTLFVTDTDSIFVSKNLKYYEEKLCQYNFLRTHQSYLINTEAIHKIKPNHVVMRNGNIVPVSVRRKANLLRIMGT